MHSVLIAYVFHTIYSSSIRTLWFHPLKNVWTAQNLLNGWTFRCLRSMLICNIYEQQMVHVRYHSLSVCGILSASSWPPLYSWFRCPYIRREGRKIRYMEHLKYTLLVARTYRDVSVCITYVIIVFIPNVYVRHTWWNRFIRSAPAPLCVCFEIVPDNPFGVAFSIRFHPPSFRYSSV